MTLGSTQPLTEMSTRNRKIIFLGSRARPVGMADNIVGSLTSHNPIGPHGCYGDSFTLWRRRVLPVRYELDCKYCYK
jgi:hypothetical protein